MCWRGHGQVRVGSFGWAGGRLCWSGNGLAMDTSVNSPTFTYYWPLPSAYAPRRHNSPVLNGSLHPDQVQTSENSPPSSY